MQTTPRTRPVIPFLKSDENRGQSRHDDKTQPFVCRMGGTGPVCFRESPATPVRHSDPVRDKDFPAAMTTIASLCKRPSLTGCKASASREANSQFPGETKRIACSSQVRTFGRALSFARRAAAAIDGHDDGCTQPWTRLFNIRSKAPMDSDRLVSGRFFGSLRVRL